VTIGPEAERAAERKGERKNGWRWVGLKEGGRERVGLGFFFFFFNPFTHKIFSSFQKLILKLLNHTIEQKPMHST
jgi:hypothetical protein